MCCNQKKNRRSTDVHLRGSQVPKVDGLKRSDLHVDVPAYQIGQPKHLATERALHGFDRQVTYPCAPIAECFSSSFHARVGCALDVTAWESLRLARMDT